MAWITRRRALQYAGLTLIGSLTGCASLGQEWSDELDGYSTESATDSRFPSLGKELPALIIRNETDRSRTLTLQVSPEQGTPTSGSWNVSSNSHREVQSFAPLEKAATVTATVKGYDATSYEWNGGGGGALQVSIESDDLSIEPIIT